MIIAEEYRRFLGLTLDDPEANTTFRNLGARIIRPGTVITMDYRPQRLNVVVDKDNYIETIWYG
jgi:hypothetical protein